MSEHWVSGRKLEGIPPGRRTCLIRHAYPSGHAAMSRLFALILGDLVPSRKKEFLARADQAALNRVIAGVHHPTDIEAGKALADILYKNLKKEPDFLSDLKAVKKFLNK